MPQPKCFILTETLIRRTLFFVLALTIISISGAELQSANVPKLMPDLVVKISAPSMANAGDDIGPLVKVRARNIGTAPAPGTTGTLNPSNGFMIDVVLSTDMTVPSGFATVSTSFTEDALLQGGRISNTSDLAPAAIRLYATGAVIPADTPTGIYYVCARIDSGGKVAELNERNNVACSRIRIRGSRKADLVVRLRAPVRARSGSDIGSSVRLSAYNIGTGPAPGTTGVLDPSNGYMIDLVLSTDTNVPAAFATFSPNFSEDVLLLGGRTSQTKDLAPGTLKTYPTGAGIPADTPTGIYLLCARIDPGSKVSESNEGNNVMCVRIRVIHQ